MKQTLCCSLANTFLLYVLCPCIVISLDDVTKSSGRHWLSIKNVENALYKTIQELPGSILPMPDIKLSEGDLMGDIIISKEDLDLIYGNQSKVSTNHKREKRKVRNFDYEPSRKWQLPIKYVIDKTTITNSTYWRMIKKAIHGWQKVTCINFEEVEDNTQLNEKHLFFSNSTDHGCSSFIGKASLLEIYNVLNSYLPNLYSQPIYLENHGCYDTVGQVMHEIGHALGLYHEAQRLDRAKHIIVLLSNVRDGELSNFVQPEYMLIDQSNMPYDLGSLMQYASLDFSIDAEGFKFTSIPVETSKVFVMGQRVEISFYDAKALNRQYCSVPDTLPCKNGGYTDPRDWSKCRCPEEWSGKYCDQVNPGSTDCSPHSGVIRHTAQDTGSVFSLFSPNYLTTGKWSFRNGDECFWIIKAPARHEIEWWLGTDAHNATDNTFFGMLMSGQGGCQAWIEIKIPGDVRGTRLCGVFNTTEEIGNWSLPTKTFSRQLHISFRSFDVFLAPLENVVKRGFHLKYKIVADSTHSSSSSSQGKKTTLDIWDSLMKTTPVPVPVWQPHPPKQIQDWYKWPYTLTSTTQSTTSVSPTTTTSTSTSTSTTTTTTQPPTTTTVTENTTVLYTTKPDSSTPSPRRSEVRSTGVSVTHTLIASFVIGCLITFVFVVFFCYFKKKFCGKKKKDEILTIEKACLCEKQKRIALLTPPAYDKDGNISVDVVSVM